MSEPGRLYAEDLAVDAETARRTVAEVVAAFQGDWDETALVLPVQAGLRHGRLRARLVVQARGDGSRVELTVEEIDYRVHVAAAGVLSISGLASLVLVAWPFWPDLAPLLPVALVLAVAGWLLVVARIQNRGPEELLAAIEAEVVLSTRT